MSSLDLITGGLMQGSGLSLVTRGLFIATGLPALDVLLDPIVDALFEFDPDTGSGDIDTKDGDLERDRTMKTAVLLSLFSDRRATADELERFGDADPRGWWGDAVATVDGDVFGSGLWLLSREKVVPETLTRARGYAADSLAWMLEDQVASKIEVEAAWLDSLDARAPRGFLALGIDITRPNGTNGRFALVWAATAQA